MRSTKDPIRKEELCNTYKTYKNKITKLIRHYTTLEWDTHLNIIIKKLQRSIGLLSLIMYQNGFYTQFTFLFLTLI